MTTRAQIAEAHRLGPIHRFAMLKLAKVDESKAKTGDLDLVKKLLGVPNGAALDKMLAGDELDGPFRRGVIYFGSDGCR